MPAISATPPAALLDTRHQVETPEGIDLILRPAGLLPRALAFGIDLLIRGAILLGAFFILAILGKTEGNGGGNDFTREFSVSALSAALAPYVGLSPHDVEQKIAFVMSGGTEGVLSPHLTVFARRPVAAGAGEPIAGKRLSIGIAQTRDFLPEELGRRAQIDETAKAVRVAMADAGIVDPAGSEVWIVSFASIPFTSPARTFVYERLLA